MNSKEPPSNNLPGLIQGYDFRRPNEVEEVPADRIASQWHEKAQSSGKWWHSQFNMMLVSFGLLTIAALMFILLAPPPELVSIAAPTEKSSPSLLPDSEAPWSQSQLAEARRNSQEVLSNLLESKKKLEQMGVGEWAPDRFESALQEASLGDEFYKKQEFAEALRTYQSAVTNLDSLFDYLPDLISSKLSAATKAIDSGKSELSTQLYQQVLQLEPSNIAAAEGLERAKKLDEVMDLVSAANAKTQQYEVDKDLQLLLAAENELNRASEIDDKLVIVNDALNNLKQKILDRKFNLAMSKAYSALFNNQYSAARKGFAEALRLKPNDVSAQNAQQQSLASDKSSSLSTLLARAQKYEEGEQWTSALNGYQAVLQRDPNQVVAKLGTIRSRARQELDARIVDILADPLSMSRNTVKESAIQALSDAKAIGSKGSRLSEQISQLEKTLQDSELSLKVSLLSNQETQVTLQKVGSKGIVLGKFLKKNLVLKPGRYVVKGARMGFKDVRTEINLNARSTKSSFSISCDTPISQSSQG